MIYSNQRKVVINFKYAPNIKRRQLIQSEIKRYSDTYHIELSKFKEEPTRWEFSFLIKHAVSNFLTPGFISYFFNLSWQKSWFDEDKRKNQNSEKIVYIFMSELSQILQEDKSIEFTNKFIILAKTGLREYSFKGETQNDLDSFERYIIEYWEHDETEKK